MATKYVRDAGKQLDPVYNGAISDVSAQIPATDVLYAALISGLEGQAAEGTQDILASAERRGVGRARLGQDVGATLSSALDLERARFGAQKAGDIAGITENLTGLRTGQVTGRQDLGDVFQSTGIATAEHKLRLDEARKKYQLELIELERSAEIAKLTAAAGGGRGGSGSGSGSDETTTSEPSELQSAYNDVNSRGADISDYEATRKSALKGNQKDKLKIELYHRIYPQTFGRSVSSDVILNNKVRF